MNTDKIKKALTIIQEAIDEVPDVAVNLELTKREVEVLMALCMTNVTVPAAVVKSRISYFRGKPRRAAEDEVCTLLAKIKQELR